MAKGKKTGGRVAGTLNKATADIKEAARVHGPEAIGLLWLLARTSETDGTRVAAIKEILDRGYGKATQIIGGDANAPIVTRIENVIIDHTKA